MATKTQAKTKEKVERKRRLAFDFTEKAADEFEALQEEMGLPTRASLLRRALSVLGYLWAAHKRGDEFVIRSEDGKEKTVELML